MTANRACIATDAFMNSSSLPSLEFVCVTQAVPAIRNTAVWMRMAPMYATGTALQIDHLETPSA